MTRSIDDVRRSFRSLVLMAMTVAAMYVQAARGQSPDPYEATVDVTSQQLDHEVAIAVLIQKYNNVVHRIDVEREKVKPDEVLIEKLVASQAALETKILRLQRDGVGDSSDIRPKEGPIHGGPGQIDEAPLKIAPAERFERWDVFRNFGAQEGQP